MTAHLMHLVIVGPGAWLVGAVLLVPWQDVPARKELPVTGRWRVEYTLPESQPSVLEFEVKESGEGSFIALDAGRSSLTPPVPGKVVLTSTANAISFTGDLNLPIGNVGIETLRLKFEGTMASATVMTGTVVLVEPEIAPARDNQRRGTFKATRIDDAKKRVPPMVLSFVVSDSTD